MIRGLHHVGLSVANLERSVAFYQDALGMQPLSAPEPFSGPSYEKILALEGARGNVVILALGTFRVELFEFAQPAPRSQDPRYSVANHGLTHFCIEVDGIDELYTRLKESQVYSHCSPLDFVGEGRATYIRDPDGNVIELYEPPAAEHA